MHTLVPRRDEERREEKRTGQKRREEERRGEEWSLITDLQSLPTNYVGKSSKYQVLPRCVIIGGQMGKCNRKVALATASRLLSIVYRYISSEIVLSFYSHTRAPAMCYI